MNTRPSDHSTNLQNSISELRNRLSSFLSMKQSQLKSSGEFECEDIRELIHGDLFEEMLSELIERQVNINKKKALAIIERKTMEQSQGYLERLFSTEDNDEFMTASGLLMLYLQEKGPKASFNGFQKFLSCNKDKPITQLTERYFVSIFKDEKEALWDFFETQLSEAHA